MSAEEIEYSILELEDEGYDYEEAEDIVLSSIGDEEITEYNIYISRISGVP
jgi:hypothetical protein